MGDATDMRFTNFTQILGLPCGFYVNWKYFSINKKEIVVGKVYYLHNENQVWVVYFTLTPNIAKFTKLW